MKGNWPKWMPRAFLCAGLGIGVAFSAFAEAPKANSKPNKGFKLFRKAKPQDYVNPKAAMPEIWTLEDVIARAMTHNPDIQQAAASARRAKGVKAISRAAMLPNARIVGDADRKEVSLIDLPPDQRNSPQDPATRQARDSYSVKVELRQPLFSGLQNQRAHKAEKLKSQSANANEQDIAQRIVAIVTQSFDAVLLAQEGISIRKQSIASFQRLLDIAEKRHEAGDIAELEILRIQTELSRAQADLSAAESRLVTARQRLRRSLALPSDAALVLAGKLAPAGEPAKIGQAIDNAMASRSDLNAAKLNWEASEASVKSAKGSKLPKLEAVASYEVRSSFFTSSAQVEGWQVGVIGSLNIFDGFQDKGVRSLRKAEADAARLEYDSLKREIESQIIELNSQLMQQRSTMQSRRAAVDLGQRALEQTEKQYAAGLSGLEEVLGAEETLHQAQFELANSVYSYNSIIAQLKYASGSRIAQDEATAAN